MTRNPASVEASGGAGRARLDEVLKLVVEHRDRHRERHVYVGRGILQQGKVAAQQRALREDREGRARFGEGRHDPGHELVAALGALIRIGVGAEHHRLVVPAAAAQLFLEHLGDIHLDDDLGVEVPARVKLEVLVRAARETVCACMTAAAVRVDGPVEGHGRRAGHVIQCRLAQHLVERHAGELGGRHRAHQAIELFEPGQGRGIRHSQFLTLPTHRPMRTKVRS